MKIVKVVLKKSNRSFDIEYSYAAEDDLAENLREGSLVNIPFGKGNRILQAYVKEVLDIELYNEDIPMGSLKKIISCEENPDKDITPEFIDMANWMSERYICSRSAAIGLMTAPGEDKIKDKKIKMAGIAISEDQFKYLQEAGKIKKIYQINILDYLLEKKSAEISELMTRFSVSANIINTMAKHDYIRIYEDIKKPDISHEETGIKRDAPKVLVKEQADAVEELCSALNKESIFSEYLIHGVTGSGKTEIYLNIIQEVLNKGRNAIILVPEISLTPQMNSRFKARFGNQVAILHSRLSQKDRYEQWQRIKQGKVKLVVGARSAIFAPFDDLGIIIIDEEHESTYKSDKSPRFHAREIAQFRSKYNNALLIYGSATPSVETAYRVQIKEIGYIKLKERASGVEMPEVKLIDMKAENEKGNRSIFSDDLCLELEKNFRRKEQTVILLNKRGHSSAIICKECGYTPTCPECNTALTYHSYNHRVICHYCGYTEYINNVCPECKNTDLRQVGLGTQRVEKELRDLYPDKKILRMDMDTTKGRTSHEDILRQFTDEGTDVLIGTQMIAKGHDFENVTLVAVMSADAGLNLEDFRASEKTFQLVTQAAGRAGRGKKRGRVIIQAQNIDDYAIIAAAKQDYKYFYVREIMIRKELDFPPFTNMAVMGLSGDEDKSVFDAASETKRVVMEVMDKMGCHNIQVLGPARYPMGKINGKYRWRLILKCKNIDELIKLCTASIQILKSYNYKKITGPSIDINPVNML